MNSDNHSSFSTPASLVQNHAKGPYFQSLEFAIAQYGGKFNAHLHLDRYGTLDPVYLWGEGPSQGFEILENSHLSLQKKHAMVAALHNGKAYDTDHLAERVNQCLDYMVAANTTRADTMVDVTSDRVGTSAIETLYAIKQQRKQEIDLRLAVYSPMGFADDEPERWQVFLEGAQYADLIGALPEIDDTKDYPSKIGFEQHCERLLTLGAERKLPVHVHLDQRFAPFENGTERLIQVVRRMGIRDADFVGGNAAKGNTQSAQRHQGDVSEPWIWAVHVLSPSTYDEPRFKAMVDDLAALNIGVICCPSAALGMRQLRTMATPTGNSIARVLEMLAAGVHVRLGCDNIADMCSPCTSPDLTDEVVMLSAALRFYQVNILAKLAAGQRLQVYEQEFIQSHLASNAREIDHTLANRGPNSRWGFTGSGAGI